MTVLSSAEVLRATQPFSELAGPLLAQAIRSAEVVFHPAGMSLSRAGGTPLSHLYVVLKGAVRIERRGEPLRLVEEGETFGFVALLTGKATFDVVVEEDLVACRIPEMVFRSLLADARFARHFAASTAERLKSSLRAPSLLPRFDLSLPVERLLRGSPAWVDPATPVHAAAALMRDSGISSLLVRGHPPGIVTDRDFRNRVLAEGLDPDTPVEAVATRPLRTALAGMPVHKAWLVLLEAGVHHLPLERDGQIVGVVTSGDLLRASAHGPLELLRRVRGLRSREGLAGHADAVAEMATELLALGLDAPTIANFVARVNDALLGRILRFAEADLGAAPGPFAWIVFGSEGRSEQTLLTDQDNALVYSDSAEGQRDRESFARLARRVNEDLTDAGFPPCPGGYMASGYNGPLSEWIARFAAYVDSPSPDSILAAGVFMDFRRAAGTLDLAPLESILAAGGRNLPFLRSLARSALDFRPPPALLLRLKGEASTVDLKRHGLGPIVFLARCYACEAGSPLRATLDRLESAAKGGLLDRPVAEAASEAFRFLLGLRLELQLRRRGQAPGGVPSSEVALSELKPTERSRLKDGLRAVKSLLDSAEYHFRVSGSG